MSVSHFSVDDIATLNRLLAGHGLAVVNSAGAGGSGGDQLSPRHSPPPPKLDTDPLARVIVKLDDRLLALEQRSNAFFDVEKRLDALEKSTAESLSKVWDYAQQVGDAAHRRIDLLARHDEQAKRIDSLRDDPVESHLRTVVGNLAALNENPPRTEHEGALLVEALNAARAALSVLERSEP